MVYCKIRQKGLKDLDSILSQMTKAMATADINDQSSIGQACMLLGLSTVEGKRGTLDDNVYGITAVLDCEPVPRVDFSKVQDWMCWQQ